MGVALSAVPLHAWVERIFEDRGERATFYEELSARTGVGAAEWDRWCVSDDSERISNYFLYWVMRSLVQYLTVGGLEEELAADPDAEEEDWNVLRDFSARLGGPCHLAAELGTHVVGTGDGDTLLIPAAFDEPAEIQGFWVGSVSRYLEAIESVAAHLAHDLEGPEPAITGEPPDAVDLALVVAHRTHVFLREHAAGCVEVG